MAIFKTAADQSKACIDECLEAARLCIDPGARNTGQLMGYPAAILLLSIVDAIAEARIEAAGLSEAATGKRSSSGQKARTREKLNCLKDLAAEWSAGYELSDEDAKCVLHWFRDALIHTGMLPAGIVLDASTHDLFRTASIEGKLTLVAIGVPALFAAVESYWGRVRGSFLPGSLDQRSPGPGPERYDFYAHHGFAIPDASGCTFPEGAWQSLLSPDQL